MRQLKVFAKPYFAWTKEEQQDLPYLLQSLIDSGVQIIKLGDKRCFFCGIPLGPASGDTKRIDKNKPGLKPLIVTTLCDVCWKRTEAENL